MKHLSFAFFAILFALFTCVSCGNDELEITEDNIIGEWVEDYSDYPYFATEGGMTWTFRSDHRVDIHVYDVFAGDTIFSKSYFVGSIDGIDNVIMLNSHMSDFSGEDYEITKLTKTKMEWQKIGTKFTPGTVGSDFRSFTKLIR